MRKYPRTFINLKCHGEATAKGRPRLSMYGVVYTPNKTKAYERWVKICFQNEFPSFEPLETPISLLITVWKKIPKSASQKKRQQMLFGDILPTTKPDVDNIAKSICDALNGFAYKDDSQVYSLVIQKLYAEEDKVIVHFK